MTLEPLPPKSDEVFLDHLTHVVSDLTAAKIDLINYGFSTLLETGQGEKEKSSSIRIMFDEGSIKITNSSNYLFKKHNNAAISSITLETRNLEHTQGRLTLNGFHPLPLTTESFSLTNSDKKQIEAENHKCRLRETDMPEGYAEFIFHDPEKSIRQNPSPNHGNNISALRAAILCVDNPDEAVARYCWFTNKGSPKKIGALGWHLALDRGSLMICYNDKLADLLNIKSSPQTDGIIGYSAISKNMKVTIEFFKKQNIAIIKLRDDLIILQLPKTIGGSIFIGENESAFPWGSKV
jgi:hypothetical protein